MEVSVVDRYKGVIGLLKAKLPTKIEKATSRQQMLESHARVVTTDVSSELGELGSVPRISAPAGVQLKDQSMALATGTKYCEGKGQNTKM